MWKKILYKMLYSCMSNKYAAIVLVLYSLASFVFGQLIENMAIFASSGAVITIFGIISMSKFTTLTRYFSQENIELDKNEVCDSETEQENSNQVNVYSEFKGLELTIIGTLVWAYGGYIPLF